MPSQRPDCGMGDGQIKDKPQRPQGRPPTCGVILSFKADPLSGRSDLRKIDDPARLPPYHAGRADPARLNPLAAKPLALGEAVRGDPALRPPYLDFVHFFRGGVGHRCSFE
jgi:hypothetical protein